MSKFVILILLVILTYILCNCHQNDNFTAIGALQQLYAKDQQDLYLTEDTEKYVIPNFYKNYTCTKYLSNK